MAVLIVALALRLGAVLLMEILGGGSLASDDDTYERLATDVLSGASRSWDGHSEQLYNTTAAFTLPLTGLYALFGVNSIVGPLFAAALGAAAAGLTTGIGLTVSGRWVGIVAGLVVALMPSQILFSSVTLKDSAVWATTAAVGLGVVKFARSIGNARWKWAGLIVAFLLVLVHLRNHTFLLALWAAGVAVIAARGDRRGLRAAGALLVIAALPWAFGLGPAGVSLVSSPSDIQGRRIGNAHGAATAFVSERERPATIALSGGEALTIDEAQQRYEQLTQRVRALEAQVAESSAAPPSGGAAPPGPGGPAGSANPQPDPAPAPEPEPELVQELEATRVEAEEVRNELTSAHLAPSEDEGEALEANVRHIPKGLSVMLLEPLPWQAGNARVQAAKVESPLWWLLLGLGGFGLVVGMRRRQVEWIYPALLWGGTLAVYALAEGNFGTAFRHRGELVWPLALLTAFGLMAIREGRKNPGTVHSKQAAVQGPDVVDESLGREPADVRPAGLT